MLDTKNSHCSFHRKITVPHNSQTLLVYFALVLLKNQPLNSGKCERRVASKGNGLKTALGAAQAGGLTESFSTWVVLFVWITQEDSVLLCCLERDKGKKHGKSSVCSLTILNNLVPLMQMCSTYEKSAFFHAELRTPGFLPCFINVD